MRVNRFDKMVSPELKELDYEDELSEMALEYVDEIVLKHGSYDEKYKKKRVSAQSFNTSAPTLNPLTQSKMTTNIEEKVTKKSIVDII